PEPPPVNTDRTVDGGIGTGPRPSMSTYATAATAPNPAAVTPAATILRSPAGTVLPLSDGVHEQRRADEGQHDGHLDLARPEHHSPGDVGEDGQGGTGGRGRRQQ